jgi:hypothetical protein
LGAIENSIPLFTESELIDHALEWVSKSGGTLNVLGGMTDNEDLRQESTPRGRRGIFDSRYLTQLQGLTGDPDKSFWRSRRPSGATTAHASSSLNVPYSAGGLVSPAVEKGPIGNTGWQIDASASNGGSSRL